jgi:hypothetical protein
MIKIDIILLLILLLIFLVMVYYGNTELLLSFIIIIILIIFKDEIISKLKISNKKEKKIENNRIIHKTKYNDEKINILLQKHTKYRRYNTEAYDNGEKHMYLFLDNVGKLSSKNMKNPKIDFENAEYHFKKSLNYFQSITVSVPENSYKNAIEINDYSNNKYGSKISKICKKLYEYCYSLLYKLSLKVNEDWIKNPTIFKSEIIYSSDNVKPNSSFETNWDLY